MDAGKKIKLALFAVFGALILVGVFASSLQTPSADVLAMQAAKAKKLQDERCGVAILSGNTSYVRDYCGGD
jgi:hypothetical protein